MAEEKLLSRSELANVVGVDDDALVFWVRNGLVPSVETGERKHRRFDGWGVKLAIVLRELRSYGMNISAMSSIVGQLQRGIDAYERIGQPPLIYDAITKIRGLEGDTEAARREMLTFNGMTEAVVAEAILGAKSVLAGQEHDWMLGAALHSEYEVLSIYRDSVDEFRLMLGGLDGPLPSPTMLLLDLRQLFDIEWFEFEAEQ